MKKSQILAALALAFALGVVAPVAGVVSNASAYSEEKGTATLADANNAISFVENDSYYKAFVKIQDAIKAYEADYTGNTADLAKGVTYSKDAEDVVTYISRAGNSSAGKYFGYKATTIDSKVQAEKSYADQITVAVDAAKNSDLYKAYAGVIAVLKDDKATDAQLIAAATTVRTTLGWKDASNNIQSGLGMLSENAYNNFHPEQATLSAYRASNPIASWAGYSEAENIYNAIETAEDNLAEYNKAMKLFVPLVANSGLMTQDAKDAVAKNKNMQPSDWYNVASDVAPAGVAYIIRNADWKALYKEVQKAKEAKVLEESGDNYTVIADLAKDWKAATGNEQALKTVMARMAAYKAPANTTDDTNTVNPDLKPGNTGALNSAAEGTASTTVSIVAGLATALTALGAGVVAYRNARRSSEN